MNQRAGQQRDRHARDPPGAGAKIWPSEYDKKTARETWEPGLPNELCIPAINPNHGG